MVRVRDLLRRPAPREQAEAVRPELQQHIDASDMGKAIKQLDELERGGYDKKMEAEGGLASVVQ